MIINGYQDQINFIINLIKIKYKTLKIYIRAYMTLKYFIVIYFQILNLY